MSNAVGKAGWTDEALSAVERENAEGMTVQQIVELFAAHGEKLTEATFRKYVQLGLLPRSRRVGRGRRQRGSQGLYPASVVRQIDEIRRLMSAGYTMEEIQRDFLFLRGDIEGLDRRLTQVVRSIEQALESRGPDEDLDDFAVHELGAIRELGQQLLTRLVRVERRMSMRARMARAVV
ncbi:MAG: MerR family transcriptional regulator [Sandaracinaceae bacterium]